MHTKANKLCFNCLIETNKHVHETLQKSSLLCIFKGACYFVRALETDCHRQTAAAQRAPRRRRLRVPMAMPPTSPLYVSQERGVQRVRQCHRTGWSARGYGRPGRDSETGSRRRCRRVHWCSSTSRSRLPSAGDRPGTRDAGQHHAGDVQ